MAKPTAKADIDPVFDAQLHKLQELSKEEAETRLKGEQNAWIFPEVSPEGGEEWTGDLFDWKGMSRMFSREKSNQTFIDATKDAENSGVVGDLIVTLTQIEYLAIMERAFRARHTMRWPRALAHAMGRKSGHGHDRGVFITCGIEYVRGTIGQSKR